MSSVSFVKIRENRIVQESGVVNCASNQQKIRVLSILGKARMGKSTFLNAIVSSLKGKSCTPFQTQDDDEHCTRGVDAYFIPEASLLLLDFQGLALEDSSHDPALLLFAYQISHLLIFNERMMLQNEALKLMEPICAFMQYIDEDTPKPALYFRISDGDIVSNPSKNLEKVMATYNDQYQSIRDSIRTLFKQEIGIVKTDTLDKPTKAQIQRGEYAGLLKKETFGFAETIESLLAALPNEGCLAEEWYSQINQIIEGINDNKKITIEKLDVVGQTTRIEILEWIQNLSTALFEPMCMDGCQSTFEVVVEPRKAMKKNILTAFTRKFKSVADALKTPYYKQLSERFHTLITVAEKESSEKAEDLVKSAVMTAQMNRNFVSLNSASGPFWSIPEVYWKNTYFRNYEVLRSACEVVYEPVRRKYVDWVDAQEVQVMLKVGELCKEEKAILDSIEEIANLRLSAFVKKTKEGILTSLTNTDVLLKNWVILQRYKDAFREDLISLGTKKIQCRKLDVVQSNKELEFTVSEMPALSRESVVRYVGFKEVFETAMASVDTLIQPESDLCGFLAEKKKKFLFGKHIPPSHWHQVVGANPEITFYEDTFLTRIRIGGMGSYQFVQNCMTQETHTTIYKPLYETCRQKMIAKEYITDSYSMDTLLNSFTGTTNYERIICETFMNYVKKEYMRLCVRGEDTSEFTL